MKKLLATCMLALRQIIWKACLVFILTAATCTISFAIAIKRNAPNPNLLFSDIMDKAHIELIFIASLIALVLLAARSASNRGSWHGYTMRRLSLSENQSTLCFAAAFSAVFFIFWAVMAVISLGLAYWFWTTEGSHPQELFYSFYVSDVLFSVLPLGSALRWMRNIFLTIALGGAVADTARTAWHGQKSPILFIITLSTVLGFFAPLEGYSDWGMIALSISAIAKIAYDMAFGGYDYED